MKTNDRFRLEDAVHVFRPDVKGEKLRHIVRRLYEWEQARTPLPVCTACGLVKGIGFLNKLGRVTQADPHPRDAGVRRDGRWYCTPECSEDP